MPMPIPTPPWWRRPDVVAVAVLLILTLVVLWHRWVFDNWLARHDLRIHAVSPYTTTGLRKLDATVVPVAHGEEPEVIERLAHLLVREEVEGMTPVLAPGLAARRAHEPSIAAVRSPPALA